MTTFFLIRHGESQGIHSIIAGRQPGVHLTALGRQQAQKLAEQLRGEPVQFVGSSPLERTQETAAPLATFLQLTPRLLPELLEIDFGQWTGKTFSELEDQELWRQWNHFRSSTRVPGGETMVEVQARMVGLMGRLQRDWPQATVALFSHGDPIRAALTYYLGMPLDLLPRLEIRPASLTILTMSEWGVQVRALNRCLDPGAGAEPAAGTDVRPHRPPHRRARPAVSSEGGADALSA